MANKKKKRKQKKLGSLILLLFLTVVLLTTSTYAWFTSNRTVTIADITVNVATSSGLQISANAVDWKTLISNTDISTGYSATNPNDATQTATDTNMLVGTIVPVSTAKVVTAGRLNMYKGDVQANETTGIFELTADPSTEAKSTTTGDFIAFDVFLKNDAANSTAVYLEPGSGVVGVTATDTAKGLQYASRIAMIKEGTVTNTASDQYTLVTPTAGTASDTIIWEPNYDGHTAHGVIQAGAYYQDYTYGGSAYSASAISAGTGNDLVSCDGVSTTISTAIPLENTNATDRSTYFTTVTPDFYTPESFSEGTGTGIEFFTLAPGITKFRVYLWIEGQDVDCENNASGSNLTYRISFSLDQHTVTAP